MNALSLAYFIVHSPTLAGPLVWILNILIYLILALIVFALIQWIAPQFGIPPRIVQLIGILIFLLVMVALLAGCQQDSRSAKVWVPTAAESDGQP